MKSSKPFPALLQAFFTDRLQGNRSPHTVASYRDTFRLLLAFARERLNKTPSDLDLSDLSPILISGFLESLETKRGNAARSRNQRLAGIRSFFRFASHSELAHADQIRQILAIPSKRHDRALVNYLVEEEVQALLAAPDQDTDLGRRDHALILLCVSTGLRVGEVVNLTWADLCLHPSAFVCCRGKGRKERTTPMTRDVARVLKTWKSTALASKSDWVFPNSRGTKLSSDGVQYLLSKHARTAALQCPSLEAKSVSPHVLRHTTAMLLLHSGIDRSMIAIWLGHERVETTQMYIDADLKLKEEILAKTSIGSAKHKRYRPDNQLLEFLKRL